MKKPGSRNTLSFKENNSDNRDNATERIRRLIITGHCIKRVN
jgi:hypothetical protein